MVLFVSITPLPFVTVLCFFVCTVKCLCLQVLAKTTGSPDMYTHKNGHICHSQYTSANSPLHTLNLLLSLYIVPVLLLMSHFKVCLQRQICSVYPYLNWLCLFCISVCFPILFHLDNLMSHSNDLSRVILSRVCMHLSTCVFIFP